MKYVLDKVKNEPPGTECLALYAYTDMAFIDDIISQNADGVVNSITADIDYISIHNHASGENFSMSDIHKLSRYSHCKGIAVVGNNGNEYMMIKTEQYNNSDFSAHMLRKSMGIDTYSSDEDFFRECEKHGVKYIKRTD